MTSALSIDAPQSAASGAALRLLNQVTCPHCWETINLTLDLSVPEQSYIEDCPVCCRPMLVSYAATDGEVAEFSVESAE